MKKIIVFDLDGTLAESKQPLDNEMSQLIATLLTMKKVAVISGGGFSQLEKQVISRLVANPEILKNLYVFPTKGAVMYTFDGTQWLEAYTHPLSEDEKARIRSAFIKASAQVDFLPTKHFGAVLEDRSTQFTFSALGQDAAPDIKKIWDPDFAKRKILQKILQQDLPDFEVEIGGSTSIDITKRGIDKAFAIRELSKYVDTPVSEMLFIGDAIFPGGNDYPAVSTGIDTIPVKDYNETKDVIKKIIHPI